MISRTLVSDRLIEVRFIQVWTDLTVKKSLWEDVPNYCNSSHCVWRQVVFNFFSLAQEEVETGGVQFVVA